MLNSLGGYFRPVVVLVVKWVVLEVEILGGDWVVEKIFVLY